jgi:hypothetical protein
MTRARTIFQIAAASMLSATLSFYGCSCDDEPGGNGTDGGSNNDGNNTGGDGNNTGPDTGLDGDGNVLPPGDGGLDDSGPPPFDSGTDAGNPLEEPRSAFCSGEGTVVQVGASQQDCAGNIAQNTFQFALCACNTISVGSNIIIDAFDSRLGAYNATIAGGGVNLIEDGHLGVNGPLNAGGKAEVYGVSFIGGGGMNVGAQSIVASTAYANGDATQENSFTTIGRNAYFNGDVIGRYDITGDLYVPATATISQATLDNLGGQVIRGPIPAVEPCPCDPGEILDIAALTQYGSMRNDNAATSTDGFTLTSTAWENQMGPSDISLPCGRFYVTSINQDGPLTITAEDRTVLYVDGDMYIGSNFSLNILPGAEVDLFVNGDLTIDAAANFGDERYPSKVRTYVAGNVILGASGRFGGNLYAPNAEIDFGASMRVYGALFVGTATTSGNAQVHFDTAIRSAGDSCEEPPMPGPDAGFDDAGNPLDAGFIDSGGNPDPGTNVDGGFDDAGNPVDGGFVDSGVSTDGGPDPGTDAGPQGCDGCNQCGDLACIIEPGMATGTCQPCVDDLDCCAPEVCIVGFCQINI